jgi:hypothetical protein
VATCLPFLCPNCLASRESGRKIESPQAKETEFSAGTIFTVKWFVFHSCRYGKQWQGKFSPILVTSLKIGQKEIERRFKARQRDSQLSVWRKRLSPVWCNQTNPLFELRGRWLRWGNSQDSIAFIKTNLPSLSISLRLVLTIKQRSIPRTRFGRKV